MSINAVTYEELLVSTIIPGIEARRTITWFDDFASIQAFVGNDHEVAHVPAAARAVLSRFDERARHYHVFGRREQEASA
jgi:hypothetical protein